jgi:hypothetical protein
VGGRWSWIASYAGLALTVFFEAVGHPNLGRPPRDLTTGFPEAAARLRANRQRLGIRALEIMQADDPTLADRYDEIGMRKLLRDTEVFVDRLAMCVAGNDPHWLRHFADQSATVFRRRQVPMDDVIRLCEGLRAASRNLLSEEEMAPADQGLDEAISVFRWYRRLAGDARKRNPILAAIYKGA